MKKSIVLLISLFAFCFCVAQNHKCAATDVAKQNIERFPSLAEHRQEVQQLISAKANELLQKPSSDARQVLTIPVVIHVLFKGSIENISEEQIYSQLDVLNADFRRQNSDKSNTPVEFQTISADMEIEFCLTKRDVNGNPTTGITRTETNFDNIGSLLAQDGRPRVFYSELGGADAWDTKKYLNIWVAKIGNGLLGMAAFPGSGPTEEDGILIDPRYFGTSGWAALNAPHHLGRTCTHEVGHYLDLQHIWGPDEDSCDEDDGVGDTPMQRNPYLNCPVHPQMSCGNRAMFMNFMDYTDDGCQNIFTQGQKARAWATFLTVRSDLVQSNALCTVKENTPFYIDGGLSLFPNPVKNRLFIEVESTGLPLKATVDLWGIDSKYLGKKQVLEGFFDVSHLEKGTYFIRTTTEEQVLFARFIKL